MHKTQNPFWPQRRFFKVIFRCFIFLDEPRTVRIWLNGIYYLGLFTWRAFRVDLAWEICETWEILDFRFFNFLDFVIPGEALLYSYELDITIDCKRVSSEDLKWVSEILELEITLLSKFNFFYFFSLRIFFITSLIISDGLNDFWITKDFLSKSLELLFDSIILFWC